MNDVFILFSPEDTLPAKEIEQGLTKDGLRVSLAPDLTKGEIHEDLISNNIRVAESVVVLLSEHSKKIEWVGTELQSALDSSKKVIPVLLDSAARENWVWPLLADRTAITYDEGTTFRELVRLVVWSVRGGKRGTHRPSVVSEHDEFDSQFASTLEGQSFLAKGDSWFSISGIPPYNLLFELRFRKLTTIVNLSQPGDMIVHMSELAENRSYHETLSAPGNNWTAIFLSGGLVDLMDKVDEILIRADSRSPDAKAPEDYCDQVKLRALIDEIQDGFRRLALMRETAHSQSKEIPIITHTYDYITPRNAPARFFFVRMGPWLYPALKNAGVPMVDWVRIADYLIDTLAEGIVALATGPGSIANFNVVDTRGATRRAELGSSGPSNDWQNELHPNDDGYKKLAQLIEKKLDTLLF